MTRPIARQLLHPFYPAGIIVSILGALQVLWLWHKYKLHIPAG